MQTMPSHQKIAHVWLLLTVSLVGCGGRPDDYVLATGEFVLEDDTRLTGVTGLVRFSPELERSERASSAGDLQTDGTFELSTYEEQHGEAYKGLRVGEYIVVLLEYDKEGKSRVIPEKYRHFQESPWKATVVADGENHFKFVVETESSEDHDSQ